MMKTVNAILLLAVSAFASGCVVMDTPYTGPVPERIIELESASADEIFQGSRQWIAENFKSANAVIQYQDQATNTVIGRGRSDNIMCRLPDGRYQSLADTHKAQCWALVNLEFVLKVEAKTGRMRVTAPTISIVWPGNQYGKARSLPAGQDAMQVAAPSVLDYGDRIAEYITQGSSGSSW